MVGVSASVNLPLHLKVQKFSSGTGLPGWSGKKGCKTVVVWWWWLCQKRTFGFKCQGFYGPAAHPVFQPAVLKETQSTDLSQGESRISLILM